MSYKKIFLLSATSIILLISYPSYAHCKWSHPHHCGPIKDIVNGFKVAGNFVYKNGKKVYKIGKPYYKKGKRIAKPAYDLYTGNYVGFIDSSGRLIKEL